MSNELLAQIQILYEDTEMLVIAKPVGIMMHPDGRSAGPFLTDWFIDKYPKSEEVGEDSQTPDGKIIKRPGIVHRLDRETSGVVILAKTKEGHAHLKKQFQDHTIVKTYLAFVWGKLNEKEGKIDSPIGRSKSSFTKWSATSNSRGILRSAETAWTKLWTGRSTIESDKKLSISENYFSLIKAEPKTGRTHQIRVHLASIHHPVVGDKLYAPNRPLALGFTRPALHSWSIEFENCAKKRVNIEAPLADDFLHIIDSLGIEIPERIS